MGTLEKIEEKVRLAIILGTAILALLSGCTAETLPEWDVRYGEDEKGVTVELFDPRTGEEIVLGNDCPCDSWEEITECSKTEVTSTLWIDTGKCVEWLQYGDGSWHNSEELSEEPEFEVYSKGRTFHGYHTFPIELRAESEVLSADRAMIQDCARQEGCQMTNPNRVIQLKAYRSECMQKPVQQSECIEQKVVGYKLKTQTNKSRVCPCDDLEETTECVLTQITQVTWVDTDKCESWLHIGDFWTRQEDINFTLARLQSNGGTTNQGTITFPMQAEFDDESKLKDCILQGDCEIAHSKGYSRVRGYYKNCIQQPVYDGICIERKVVGER